MRGLLTEALRMCMSGSVLMVLAFKESTYSEPFEFGLPLRKYCLHSLVIHSHAHNVLEYPKKCVCFLLYALLL